MKKIQLFLAALALFVLSILPAHAITYGVNLGFDEFGVKPYATSSDFPIVAIDGALAVDKAAQTIYMYDINTLAWVAVSGGGGGGSGTVTSVSVVSANGLAGTVANATTTPAITLTTSVNGLVKGNGTALSAAVSGTDYLAPFGGATSQYVRGNNTLATLDTSVVPENGNLYFTTARAKSAAVADAIVDAVTDVAPSQNAVFDALALKIASTEKGANNGVATLDAGGKIPSTQLPNSVMEYQGVWNATTNSPALADGSGNAGDVYRISVAGTQNLGSGAIVFAVGDYAIYNGTVWEKSDTTDSVDSVNGQQGVVSLDSDDITEGATNLYFTAARAKTAVVDDTITDGVTDKAPSQNAAFDALALKAPLASPALTGNPTAPTQTAADNSTKIATTAYADNAASSVSATKWSLSGDAGTGGTGKLGTTDAQNFDIIAGNATIATIVQSYKGISAAPIVVPADATSINQFDWRTYVSPTASTTGANHVNQYNQLIWDNPNAGFNNSSGSLAAVSNNFSMNGSGTINYASANTNSGNFNNGVTTQYKGVTSENSITTGAEVTDYYGIVSGLNTTGGILGTHTGISQYGGFNDATFSSQSTGFSNSDSYSGTTTLVQGVTGFNSYLQFNDTTAITNTVQGFSSGIDLNDDVVTNGVNGVNVYLNNRNNASAGGINLNSISLNHTDASTSSGVNGYNANIQFSGTSDTGGVNLINTYARTSDTAHLDSLNVINANPEIEGSSTVDNMTLLSLSGQIRGNSVVQNLNGGYINPQMSGSAAVTNFTGLTVQPQVNGTSTLTNSLTGLQVQPQSAVAINGATGVSVDMGGVALDSAYIAAGGQKTGLNINDGALSSNYNYTVPGASSFFQINYLGGGPIVAAGDPTSAFGFGNNLAHTVTLHDDWNLDGAGLGFVDVGFVGALSFDAGTTMASWTGALGGAGNPSGAGTLTTAKMFSAAGILPQGGSLSVTNMYGFEVNPNLFCIIGTNCWGFYEDTAAAQNHMSKLAIGTASKKVSNTDVALEIGNKKQFIPGNVTTAEKNALTAVESGIVYDTTLNQPQWYDGSAWQSFGSSYTPPTEAQEVVSGTVDNSNDTFVLANTPVSNASVKVYLDGLIQVQGVQYTISGDTITMAVAPDFGQTVYANYSY